MMFKIATALISFGLIIMTAAYPVSAYVNGAEIYTVAGNIAGNHCMMYGLALVLFGGVILILNMFFED